MSRFRTLQSTRHRTVRKKKALWVAALSAVAAASALSAVVLFIDAPFVRISQVTVTGGDPATAAAVEGVIKSSIEGNYLGIIPRDSTFFFPERALSSSLPLQFPIISSASVSRQGFSGATAVLAERVPAEVACTAPGDCYYADADGFIFEPAPSSSGALPVYDISLPASADPEGVQFIDSARLAGMAAFASGLARLGFSASYIALSTSTSGYDYDVYAHDLSESDATSTIDIAIDESKPFAESLQDFSAFWSQHLALTATDTNAKPLSLVDLRYGDNIIYR